MEGEPQADPDGKHCIAATCVYACGTGSVKPLALNNRSVRRSQFGAQGGVIAGIGLTTSASW